MEVISVIMPTYGRPEQAAQVVRNFIDNTPNKAAEMVVVIDNEDWESYDIIGKNNIFPTWPFELRRSHCGPVSNWNKGFERARGELYAMAADDIYFPDGWLDNALDWYKPGHLLSLADDYRRGLATHYMVDRQAIKEILGGVLCVPHYFSQYLDVEATERARRMGRLILPDEPIIEHRHHVFGTAEMDATYQIGGEWMAKDAAVFKDRQARGFPNDYEPIIT